MLLSVSMQSSTISYTSHTSIRFMLSGFWPCASSNKHNHKLMLILMLMLMLSRAASVSTRGEASTSENICT